MKSRFYAVEKVYDEKEARQVVNELELALQRELPAFWPGAYFTDDGFALTVEIFAESSTPDTAFERLPGFPIAGRKLVDVTVGAR